MDISSFLDAFNINYIILSAVGALLGIIWGAMPGLSTSMAMALLVGLSAGFALNNALAFILGVFTGSVFGGAITAILINIPGTPDAVPTQMAGYPLAQRGQAGVALGTSITFSMIGNWIGILSLIFFLPLIIRIALKFGSWEMFWLALWGICVSGTLVSDEKILKGWIAGWLGLLLSFIGRDIIYSAPRFTFGIRELMSGVPYLPILIGLFGLTEVFMVLTQKQPKGIPQRATRVIPPLNYYFKYWKSALRSGIIGIVTGIIPGGGANMATFVSYGIGERVTGRNFSRGDIEGVVCSEVANNANLGGALMPTLVLGIPGSAPAAAFLAALNLQGVIVGPAIQFNHPGLIEFIYGTLIVANIAMLICAFLLIKPSIKIFSLPREILMPVIPVLCLIGGYAARLSSFDIIVTFVFGILGFVMRKFKYPLAPMVLGAILGNMVDENFRKSMIIFRDVSVLEVLSRPVGTTIIIIVLLTILYALKKRKSYTIETLSQKG